MLNERANGAGVLVWLYHTVLSSPAASRGIESESGGFSQQMPCHALMHACRRCSGSPHAEQFQDARVKKLQLALKVESIPTVVLVEGATGKLITRQGREAMHQPDKFPWRDFKVETTWTSYMFFVAMQLAFVTVVLWYAKSQTWLQVVLIGGFVFNQWFGKKKQAVAR